MLILTLEVQSSRVRGSLARLAEGARPEILFADERPVAYAPGISTARFVQDATKALGQSVDAALVRFSALRAEHSRERFPRHIDQVHYILSSPWIAVQARSLSLDLGRLTKITPAKIKEILDGERAKMAPSAEGPTTIIEEKIFDVRLNGYSIASWQNKEAAKIEIAYALGVAGTGALARFEQACERAVPRERVHFHSSLLLQYAGLRAAEPALASYTLIHIHGELTDVVIVSRGACIFFGSYPTGIRSIVRATASATGDSDEAADSFISLYEEKHLEQDKSAKSRPAMKAIADGWVRQFRDLVRDSQAGEIMPADAFIVARSHQAFFADAFREAYPQARVESREIDPGLYASAIHSLGAGLKPRV